MTEHQNGEVHGEVDGAVLEKKKRNTDAINEYLRLKKQQSKLREKYEAIESRKSELNKILRPLYGGILQEEKPVFMQHKGKMIELSIDDSGIISISEVVNSED